MSGPAHHAAFKSGTEALIERLRLTPREVIGLGLALAASHATSAGIPKAMVTEALDESLEAAEAKRPGIVAVGGDHG